MATVDVILFGIIIDIFFLFNQEQFLFFFSLTVILAFLYCFAVLF